MPLSHEMTHFDVFHMASPWQSGKINSLQTGSWPVPQGPQYYMYKCKVRDV